MEREKTETDVAALFMFRHRLGMRLSVTCLILFQFPAGCRPRRQPLLIFFFGSFLKISSRLLLELSRWQT